MKYILAALFALVGSFAYAQVGFDAVSLNAAGSFTATTHVSVGTSGSVSIVAANPKRVDLTCFNNSAFTVWVGTNAVSTTLSTIGLPVTSSTTVNFGAFSDAIFGIATGGTAEMDCWEAQIR